MRDGALASNSPSKQRRTGLLWILLISTLLYWATCAVVSPVTTWDSQVYSVETYILSNLRYGNLLGPPAFVRTHSNRDGVRGAAANFVNITLEVSLAVFTQFFCSALSAWNSKKMHDPRSKRPCWPTPAIATILTTTGCYSPRPEDTCWSWTLERLAGSIPQKASSLVRVSPYGRSDSRFASPKISKARAPVRFSR
jgi:hypothetical protein